VETTQTKGRKSHKPAGGTGRKKATQEGIVAEEEEVKGEDPVVAVEDEPEEAEENGEPEPAVENREEIKPPAGARRSGRAKKAKSPPPTEDIEMESEEEVPQPKARALPTKKRRGKAAMKKDVEMEE
jgi:hypothetical protein